MSESAENGFEDLRHGRQSSSLARVGEAMPHSSSAAVQFLRVLVVPSGAKNEQLALFVLGTIMSFATTS